MKICSLFSGIGGLELGLEAAGVGETFWQVEQDAFCRSILAKHWPDAKRFEDVRTVGAEDIGGAELLCGGFPCQDISLAGRGGGLAGERSGLWGNMQGSFAWYCHDSSSLRTFQRSLGGDCQKYSASLPGAGMMQSGILSARQPSGRATEETGSLSSHGFGMLPTPTASAYGSSNNGFNSQGERFKQRGKPSLWTMAARGLLGSTPGKLSVEFLRWMMGFPINWLGSEP